jgi:hypothetical protein
VNNHITANGLRKFSFVRGTDNTHHLTLVGFGELYKHATDTPRTGMHQHPCVLSRDEQFIHGVPGCECGGRKGAGVGEVELFG